VYIVDDEMIKSEVPKARDELIEQKVEVVPGTLKIYAQGIFFELVKGDRNFLSILESLDLKANREQLNSASQDEGKGGKSGEFFFTTRDKKLIVKTIPDLEKDRMVNILEEYSEYLKRNPQSLIAKIYGVFTYENSDLG